MKLFIVESPAKAKTIGQYLGKDFYVIASLGHIRELVRADGSIDVNDNFKMKYQLIAKAKAQVNKIVDLAKKSNLELPIIFEVYKILFENKDPKQSVLDLMLRAPKPEQI